MKNSNNSGLKIANTIITISLTLIVADLIAVMFFSSNPGSNMETINKELVEGLLAFLIIFGLILVVGIIAKISNAPMTSAQALAKLKKDKEKFDLKLISEDEYNKRKEELSTFIE
jgi:uncharacterized membrane protein